MFLNKLLWWLANIGEKPIPLMRSLRYKIALGYIVLVCINIVTGIFAVYSFSQLAKTGRIFSESFQSVQITNDMIEALARQDQARLELSLANADSSMERFKANSDLVVGFAQTIHDLGLPTNPALLDSIISAHAIFGTSCNALYRLLQAQKDPAAVRRLHETKTQPLVDTLH